jgi:RimJ/RimL family protein N-acetyltransferase
MSQRLRLRAATQEDTDLLLDWRNDVRTRMASQNTTEVRRDDHVKWLAGSLRDENRILMVAEENEIPVGTVRADLKNGVYDVSWTVAPGARGRGVGKAMVALFLSQLPGVVRADVKKDNHASACIAESAGMQLFREERGVLHYKRGDVATFGRKRDNQR